MWHKASADSGCYLSRLMLCAVAHRRTTSLGSASVVTSVTKASAQTGAAKPAAKATDIGQDDDSEDASPRDAPDAGAGSLTGLADDSGTDIGEFGSGTDERKI